MNVVCTSCGGPIPSSLNYYKCRQCVNHFVCQSCEPMDHNRACATFHTLDKKLVSNVQPKTDANNVSSKGSDSQQSKTATSSKPSSIFNSEEYLHNTLGYCGQCSRLVILDREITFQCNQCPNGFGICAECLPLMDTHHPAVHTFSKQPLSHYTNLTHDIYHLDIICNGCSRNGFNGKRYQCEQCPPSYDLCENCFGKEHTHHHLKYIQNPLLHAGNKQVLGLRTVAVAKTNGGDDTNWRDPLTGWTKSDAELVIQQAQQGIDNYNNRLQQIRKINEERKEEENRLARQRLADAERRSEDAIADAWRVVLRPSRFTY
ncbi:unnamed protein product [Adineta steineri]|uniref:ZZ-type domain-containing protein n=1 Tax=Adineta steineri TaxID=433720 RepID=A0A814SR13_9BILA|nr:unnamed protein product [Adineta steineri]CAF1483203.1 unnamed protein product [Adineta steineri]